jgi:hypothetical protein
MAKIGIGLDIGSTAAKLAAGRMEKGAFIPLKAAVIPRPPAGWRAGDLAEALGRLREDLSLQSGGDLSADYNRLAVPSSLSEDDAILLTLVKNTLLEERLSLLKGGRVAAEAFTPNAIALFNLASRTADLATGTTLLLDVGAEAVDLAVAQEGSLVFARNLAGGSALFNGSSSRRPRRRR